MSPAHALEWLQGFLNEAQNRLLRTPTYMQKVGPEYRLNGLEGLEKLVNVHVYDQMMKTVGDPTQDETLRRKLISMSWITLTHLGVAELPEEALRFLQVEAKL